MNRLEQTILRNLMYNEEYTRKVLPFISESYFSDRAENILYKEIETFVHKYKSLPSKESLIIDLTESKDLTESDLKRTTELVNSLSENKNEVNEMQWLIDQTEKFCQDKAIYNAIMESVQILDDKSSTKSKGSIPQLLSDALGVSFDSNVGHDYLVDYDERFDFYHRKEKKVKFDLDYFNKITKGGVPVKTLNVILAGCVHPETKVKIRIRKHNAN